MARAPGWRHTYLRPDDLFQGDLEGPCIYCGGLTAHMVALNRDGKFWAELTHKRCLDAHVIRREFGPHVEFTTGHGSRV